MAGFILIVDDEPGLRYLYQEVLTDLGYETKCAANGWECMTIAKATHKPSLILLDYQMPQLNGLEVLSALKKDQVTRVIPVIMASAQENLKEMVKSYEVEAVLAKPLDFHKLAEAIQQTFDGYSKSETVCMDMVNKISF